MLNIFNRCLIYVKYRAARRLGRAARRLGRAGALRDHIPPCLEITSRGPIICEWVYNSQKYGILACDGCLVAFWGLACVFCVMLPPKAFLPVTRAFFIVNNNP